MIAATSMMKPRGRSDELAFTDSCKSYVLAALHADVGWHETTRHTPISATTSVAGHRHDSSRARRHGRGAPTQGRPTQRQAVEGGLSPPRRVRPWPASGIRPTAEAERQRAPDAWQASSQGRQGERLSHRAVDMPAHREADRTQVRRRLPRRSSASVVAWPGLLLPEADPTRQGA